MYTNFQNHYMEKCSPNFREATEEELKAHSSEVNHINCKYGSFYSSMVIECKIFLPWALKKYVSTSIEKYLVKIKYPLS